MRSVCRYGVAFLYAGKLVREEGSGYTAGRVMNVIVAVIMAGLSVGHIVPNFSTFASGMCISLLRLPASRYSRSVHVSICLRQKMK